MGNDEEVRITLRLPSTLRDRLNDAANSNSRSMNGEMIYRLTHSFEGQSDMFPELGVKSERFPRLNYHEFLNEKELAEAIEGYTQNIQDCARVLKDLSERNKRE